MAPEPPNPYAPSAFLADAERKNANDPKNAGQDAAARPSRLGAILLSLFSYPFSGAGFYVLNRPRLLVRWLVAGPAAWALTIAGVRTGHLKVSAFAYAVAVVMWLAAVVATAFARPGAAQPAGRSWLFAIAVIAAANGSAVAVRHWLIEAFQIPSGAMMPTLLVGDRIMIKKGSGDVARGDVIVFEFPADRSTDYIFRVVAIGGDRISVMDGVVSINGVPLPQVDVGGPCPASDDPIQDPRACRLVRETNAGRSYTIMLQTDFRAPDFGPAIVPEGQVLVLGDNRDNSYDSRKWGTVPVDHIKGKANLIWWSKDAQSGMRWSRVGRAIE